MILQLYGYYFIPTQTFNHKYVNWRCVATFIYQLSPPYHTLARKNYIYKLHNPTRYLMDRLKTTYPVYLCSNGSEASKQQQHVVKHRQLFCGQKPKRNHDFQINMRHYLMGRQMIWFSATKPTSWRQISEAATVAQQTPSRHFWGRHKTQHFHIKYDNWYPYCRSKVHGTILINKGYSREALVTGPPPS